MYFYIVGNETPDIRTLSILLASVFSWENLGVQLGIEMYKLKEIRDYCNGDLEMCKNRLYDLWLRQNTSPTWREVVNALELIEEKNLADRIRRLYLQHLTEGKFEYIPKP